jgi:hypothetical protein
VVHRRAKSSGQRPSGINVRIHYGPDGKIDSVETLGKADQNIAPNADANEKNPWDEVLNDAAE